MPPDVSADRSPPRQDATTATAVTASAAMTILNRYDLIEPIGSGGMGRVFLARDTVLKREVAIKVLAPDLAAHPRFAEQMLREARAIAQLHHPHIATVYDVVDDAGSLCIVMEYLRGETLASRLRRGPLEYSEAIRHGCQITQALHHAHTQGIVHCDLKPGNVFLTKHHGVKVVDFGLARVVGRPRGDTTDGIGASATLIEHGAGTPGYMAPEQKLGLPLDHRADIYSFGVVLHEMVTGRMPDRVDPARSARELEPRTAAGADMTALTPILERTLAPEAAARFQNAGELEAALQGLSRARKRAWSRASVLLVAALAVLVGALAGALRMRPSPPLSGVALPVVGVSRFMSNPGDTSMAYLAVGLGEMVAGDLGASNAVVPARTDVVVTSAEEARTLAHDLGAGAVILGKVERTDERVVASLRLFAAGAESLGDSTSVSRPADDLYGIRRALTSAVRGLLSGSGVRFRDTVQQGAARSTERLLPATMDAFEEYAQARWFLERVDVDANVDHAISVLERLVAREPGFALAHASLGEATWRKWQSTREPAWSEAAPRHALEALRLAPDQPEVRYALALIYQGTGKSKEALSELEQVARTRPTNDDVHRVMGRLYADAGRLDEGLEALNRAISLRPGYWGNHAALGNVAYRHGMYPVAIAAFQRFCELRPDSASAHQRLGTAYHMSGNLQAALQSYERALQISPNANAYSNVGTAQFEAGRYSEAVDAYKRAIALEPRNPSLHRNLADALTRAGATRSARTEYARAVDLATEMLRVNPKDASTLSVKAVGLARTGRVVEGYDVSVAALRLAPTDYDVLFEHALILTLLDRKTEAVTMLERAVAAGYSAARLRSDPNLASLSELPAFQALTARKP
jgi:eukaryotic-like serine/threonine-protein kinase